VVRELMRASGAGGMIGGQQLDLEGEGMAHSLDQLSASTGRRPGALITAAVRIGGVAAGADAGRLAALGRYGEASGSRSRSPTTCST
jgi:geranylgeranyl pyrophosphate synthase